jgi:hypothetical protein
MTKFRIRIFGLYVLAAVSAAGGSAESKDAAKLIPPANVRVLSRQLRVDVIWDGADTSARFEVQRASHREGPFEILPEPIPGVCAFSDFIGTSGGNYFYRIRTVRDETNQPVISSSWSEIYEGAPRPLDPNALITEVQEAGFRYFYDYAHPVSGLARVGTTKELNVCSIGGTGWTLYNLVAGANRGFVSHEEAAQRALKILQFLSDKADRFHGAFPHWIDGATGKVIPFSQYDDGADLVETAFLMEGVILTRQYFDAANPTEAKIRQLANNLWRGVEWDWFAQEKNGLPVLLWHWSPNFAWKKDHAISGFNECQIAYVLALASPTHPVPAKFYWQGWQSTNYGTTRTKFGIELKLGKDFGPPLFWTHYSYLGLDPHQISFQNKTYFDHFRDFCRVQILYADSKRDDFKGYGALWGLTASRGPKGYRAFAPGPRDNGTISPTAAISSMPYVPDESRTFLLNAYRQYGKQCWGPFGFYDAFNLSENWFAHDYLGNEVGPIAPMIENYRSGVCWKTFMGAPEIRSVVKLLAEPPPASSLAVKQQ